MDIAGLLLGMSLCDSASRASNETYELRQETESLKNEISRLRSELDRQNYTEPKIDTNYVCEQPIVHSCYPQFNTTSYERYIAECDPKYATKYFEQQFDNEIALNIICSTEEYNERKKNYVEFKMQEAKTEAEEEKEFRRHSLHDAPLHDTLVEDCTDDIAEDTLKILETTMPVTYERPIVVNTKEELSSADKIKIALALSTIILFAIASIISVLLFRTIDSMFIPLTPYLAWAVFGIVNLIINIKLEDKK